MNRRAIKDLLYEHVARIGKALASPKRLEILELLAQGEKSVDTLSTEIAIDIKLTSAHLRSLREAHLVKSRRDGKRVLYRLSGSDVAHIVVSLRQVAQEHLVDLRLALRQLVAEPEPLTVVRRQELLTQARRGDVVVLDVRPVEEFKAAHLPYARSMPLSELARRLSELPRDVEIVAYCRGPFCLMSDEAVKLLSAHGFQARKISEGIPDWQSTGLPVIHQ